jgi:hypothetical protein
MCTFNGIIESGGQKKGQKTKVDVKVDVKRHDSDALSDL